MTSTELSTVNEYISSLSDLKTNFKPLINMLTILAEENVEYAPAIVQAIENHLQQAKSNSKLPVFYLIDSIVKNVGGDYRSLFARNIVNTFCSVFEKVDEATRVSLRKLRRTWNNVFPAKNLSSLDVRVGLVDSSRSTTVALAKPTSLPVRRFEFPFSDAVTANESATQEQLIVKRELLDLEMQKIELELLQAKMSLKQQRRQLEEFMTLTSLPTNQPGSSNGPRIEPAVSKAIASVRPVTRDPSTTTTSFQDRAVNNTNSQFQRSETDPEGAETAAGTHRASSVSHIATDHFSAQFERTTQSRTIIVEELSKNSSHSDIAEMTSPRNTDNFDMTMAVNSDSNSESHDRNKIKDVQCWSQQKDDRITGNGIKMAENLLTDNSTVDSIHSSLSSSQSHESIEGIGVSRNSSLSSLRRHESIEGIGVSRNSSLSSPQRLESIDGIVDSTNSSLLSPQRHESIEGIGVSRNSSLSSPQRHKSIEGIGFSRNSSLSSPHRHKSIEGIVVSRNSLLSSPQRHESIEGIVVSRNSSLSSPQKHESIEGIGVSRNSSLSSPQRHESIEGIGVSRKSLLSSSQRHESIDSIVDSTNSSLSSPQRHESIDGIVDSTNSSLSSPQRHDSIDIKSVDATDARFMKPFQRKLGCKSSSKLSQGSPSKKQKTNRYCETPHWSESEEKENTTIPWSFRSRTSSKDTYQSSKSRRMRFELRKRASRNQRHNEATVNLTSSCTSGITSEEHLISPMVSRSPLKHLTPVGMLQDSQHVDSTRREFRACHGGFNEFKSETSFKRPKRPGVMGPPDPNRFEEPRKNPIEPSLTVEMEVDEETESQPAILPVLFDEPETLKVRQPMIVTALYSGIQCGTCGVRFDSKHMTQYRLHLDWHFRQNRKKRESGRKPLSQQFYYNLQDWMEFTLVEDSANRTLSFFETAKQLSAINQRGTDDSSRATTTVQPSILCRSGGDFWCKVCQETFEEFYDDEEEEWCLRPTVNYEGTNYHPLCLDDYKRSLEKSSLVSMKEKENLQTREDTMDGAKDDSFQYGNEEINQELSNISFVEKGHEMSALCSIM